MKFPPLQPISNTHYYVNGDVTIGPGAAIAPGVLLQADPESQIIIGAGACIGMGAVLHAYHGVLEVGESANIGTGVLIVGKGKVGTNACIGAMTTIFNSSVESGEVLPPGSLIGDTSRPEEAQLPEVELEVVPTNGQAIEPASINSTPPVKAEVVLPQALEEEVVKANPVYGEDSLNRLLSTLLPHRQALNRPLDNSPNSS
ncbi:MAG: carbon dioxide concentrating mechanism protein [Chroococcus sp. CMT-3BRIN-NPC107]|jgi:carbon dioxide concentrating mechanism protein CcmN|nr:carbon dioxide concentrating mechanism protein [Chroococcus sp. CMT-3BRIN-NPC107]